MRHRVGETQSWDSPQFTQPTGSQGGCSSLILIRIFPLLSLPPPPGHPQCPWIPVGFNISPLSRLSGYWKALEPFTGRSGLRSAHMSLWLCWSPGTESVPGLSPSSVDSLQLCWTETCSNSVCFCCSSI